MVAAAAAFHLEEDREGGAYPGEEVQHTMVDPMVAPWEEVRRTMVDLMVAPWEELRRMMVDPMVDPMVALPWEALATSVVEACRSMVVHHTAGVVVV